VIGKINIVTAGVFIIALAVIVWILIPTKNITKSVNTADDIIASDKNINQPPIDTESVTAEVSINDNTNAENVDPIPRPVRVELRARISVDGSLLECSDNSAIYFAVMTEAGVADTSTDYYAADGALIVKCGGGRTVAGEESGLCENYSTNNCADITNE
jgi:hypothetical protein